ncbi:putative leucine-rich repeat-containing protein 49 isoform X1 [Penaeus vannamei]|uniref:Putative leucine-rich repeat-containing protein 49 isoform X1 n=1 Tax=Penaeus vannamei TaxID=6689 RepID=A0A423SY03_PENVA|nr:putative leucine-rich repeat-containing protein 49 isoform X1 [Penaeus vannamei]
MKHWRVVKKDHKKLVRKPSESSCSTSDHPLSKASDATEHSSGFCGDTVSDVGEDEAREEELEVTVTSGRAGEREGDGEKEERAKGDAHEDDRSSLISSGTSSGISDISLVQRPPDRRLSHSEVPFVHESAPLSATKKASPGRTDTAGDAAGKGSLPRSKSYTDMRVLRRKNSSDGGRRHRPKSVRGPDSRGSESDGAAGGAADGGAAAKSSEMINLDMASRGGGAREERAGRAAPREAGQRALGRGRREGAAANHGQRGRRQAGERQDDGGDQEAGDAEEREPPARQGGDGGHHARALQPQSSDAGPRGAAVPAQRRLRPSEIDSSSDAESAATNTTTTTAATPTSSLEIGSAPARGQPNLADLRVPLARPKEAERTSFADRGDRALASVAPSAAGILREQGPNFLAELEGDCLSLYGQGALRCTDIAWEKALATAATTARFQYMNFDDIVDIFPKLRVKFARLENFVFVETHLAKCSQLNALAELHQVTSLDVGSEGNPLSQISYWRLYAVFRLSHWGLRVINGVEITEEERTDAAIMFSSLSHLAFTCLPRDQLAAFLSSHHHHNSDQASGTPPPGGHQESGCGGSSQKEDGDGTPRLNVPHLQDLIGKEALQYRPSVRLSQDESSALAAAGRQARQLVVWTYDSLQRLQTHHATWPSVLHDLVRDAVTDISKPTYGKQCLEEVKRDLGWKK